MFPTSEIIILSCLATFTEIKHVHKNQCQSENEIKKHYLKSPLNITCYPHCAKFSSGSRTRAWKVTTFFLIDYENACFAVEQPRGSWKLSEPSSRWSISQTAIDDPLFPLKFAATNSRVFCQSSNCQEFNLFSTETIMSWLSRMSSASVCCVRHRLLGGQRTYPPEELETLSII